MGDRYGYSDEQWSESRDEVTRVLQKFAKQLARRQGRVSYSDLTAVLREIHFSPEDHAFHAMLAEVSTNEHKAGRPLLTAIVVHKSGDTEPGQGFYRLARTLGYTFDDDYIFWSEEYARVLKYWG